MMLGHLKSGFIHIAILNVTPIIVLCSCNSLIATKCVWGGGGLRLTTQSIKEAVVLELSAISHLSQQM